VGDPVGWLREALAWFDAHGYDRAASACRKMLRQAGASVPRRGSGDTDVPADLSALGVTTREMDVLALVAEGLTNAEIAQLYLSPRTIEKHIASLMQRTGARGRAQLATLAARAAH
jgi:DNA-binding NarL/FixJ family response regulator